MPASDIEPKRKAAAPHRITEKVRIAIDAMVWQGLPRREAAQVAGISEHGLYKAFAKPPVKAAYLAALEVLRTSALARNFHRLEAIAAQDDNPMAAVAAIRQMGKRDELSDPRGNIGTQSPGLTIQIVSDAPKPLTINQTMIPDE
jgi:hypothetical protein